MKTDRKLAPLKARYGEQAHPRNRFKRPARLLSTNTKLAKGNGAEYRTLGLQLAPSDASGFNVCPSASKGCRAACLFTAGRGVMKTVADARINKTRYLKNDAPAFMAQLVREIASAERAAAKQGQILALRLNVLSDIAWEEMPTASGGTLFDVFPNVQFYDYTKRALRAWDWIGGRLPENYHLTFSRSESNDGPISDCTSQVNDLLGKINIAVVFRGALPIKYRGRTVIDGDRDDLRFLDPPGVIVGLVEKGLAKKDESGFVIEGGSK